MWSEEMPMKSQPLKRKTIKGEKPKGGEVLTQEQLEVGVDLPEEVEVGGDLHTKTKTGTEKGKRSMMNGTKNKTLAPMTKEVKNTGWKTTGEGTKTDQIDHMMTPIMTPR